MNGKEIGLEDGGIKGNDSKRGVKSYRMVKIQKFLK